MSGSGTIYTAVKKSTGIVEELSVEASSFLSTEKLDGFGLGSLSKLAETTGLGSILDDAGLSEAAEKLTGVIKDNMVESSKLLSELTSGDDIASMLSPVVDAVTSGTQATNIVDSLKQQEKTAVDISTLQSQLKKLVPEVPDLSVSVSELTQKIKFENLTAQAAKVGEMPILNAALNSVRCDNTTKVNLSSMFDDLADMGQVQSVDAIATKFGVDLHPDPVSLVPRCAQNMDISDDNINALKSLATTTCGSIPDYLKDSVFTESDSFNLGTIKGFSNTDNVLVRAQALTQSDANFFNFLNDEQVFA